jgi:protein-tyrosine phosphatase
VSGVTRDIALVNTYNLRDLGGYPTVDGRQVRWRRLFRGAGLQRLSDDDLETVRGLGLVTVVDLRTEGELAASGGYALPATFHHLPMLTTIWDLSGVDPHVAADEYLAARYAEMLDEGATTIAAVMRILARPESFPVVFYCAAGKDRTGVLAALVLDAIGVEPEHIVADYHLSKERVERIRARAAAASGAMLVQPPPFMQAPAGAMRLLLEAIRHTYGSTADYLAGIGIERAALDAVAANLLEDAHT